MAHKRRPAAHGEGMKIAGFVPWEMRVEMVREMVERMGIRPLSSSIGVNSKTVYKYKKGEAVPTDETLSRLLELLRERDPEVFWRYMGRLRKEFEEAMLSLEGGEPRVAPSPGGELSRFEVYQRLGIESPSERIRLARILSFLAGVDEFGLEELVGRTMLRPEEAEGYLDRLVGGGVLERTPVGTYRVKVRCRL